ncbi:DUF4397 domain-containing protein [Echinicola soli]|uniref:DUF4397 domain-containing protein n=1 Tax=Echinicola soli TaxID=2591634 RepID=A0A514CDX0_9BACT|nr:DUF4397 domain-containing protein [Echinicola soli]QDH77844.1 DUF4397 domain-containing protein [Echinicola soli]
MLTRLNKINLSTKWKRSLGLILLALSPLLITSCLDDDDTEYYDGPLAYVSFYHGSPETGAVTIYADGVSKPPYSTYDFKYTDYFNYANFYTGERTLSFKNRNANNSLLDTTVSLEENQVYSFFFIDGEESDMDIVQAEDEWDSPAEDKAMVRLVNLSPDSPALNLYINDKETPTFEGEAFKSVTDFVEIDADLTTFTVEGAGEINLTAEDLDLRAERVYTVIVRGYVNPESGSNSEKDLSIQVIRNYPNY